MTVALPAVIATTRRPRRLHINPTAFSSVHPRAAAWWGHPAATNRRPSLMVWLHSASLAISRPHIVRVRGHFGLRFLALITSEYDATTHDAFQRLELLSDRTLLRLPVCRSPRGRR